MKKIFLVLSLFVLSLISGYYAYDKIYPIKIQKFAEPLHPLQVFSHTKNAQKQTLDSTSSDCLGSPISPECALDTEFFTYVSFNYQEDYKRLIGQQPYCEYGYSAFCHLTEFDTPKLRAYILMGRKKLTQDDINKYRPVGDWKTNDIVLNFIDISCFEDKDDCLLNEKAKTPDEDWFICPIKECKFSPTQAGFRQTGKETWRITEPTYGYRDASFPETMFFEE